MRLPKAALVIAVLVAAAAAGGAWLWRSQAVAVTLTKPHYGPAVELVYGTGFVEAQQPVSVQARITAPVERVLVEEGQRVTRGQALFLLADDEQRALSAQAAAQRRAAEQTEQRTVTLFRQGWVTKAARDQAVANADAARAAEATAGARREQLVVRAEIDGIVTKRDVEPGELATPTRVLAQLGDPARIRITATIDERDIARVGLGQEALMSSDAWPGKAIPARVAEITPGGDPTQRAFRVRLLPTGAANLPLGLSLEVNIVTRRKDRALLVPATAVAGGKAWVVRDGRAHRVDLRTGIQGSEAVEILAGVTGADTLIDKAPGSLAEGQRVKAAK
jgi:RND family efflux transporter MFP subunit